jgi:hypothetical protein
MDHKKQESVFTLNPRNVSAVVALVLAMAFFIFMAGYFLGQKRAAEQFTYRIDQESLADQIYSSVCGLYDDHSEDELDDSDGIEKTEIAHLVQEQERPQLLVSEESIHSVAEQPASKNLYSAQLVGFGTKVAAQKCLNRLASLGYQVAIQERASSSRGGKKVSWYQVVTHQYHDKNALMEDVEKIKKIERIHDVRIVTA